MCIRDSGYRPTVSNTSHFTVEGIRAAILHLAVRRQVRRRALGSHATGHMCQPTGHIGRTTGHIGRPTGHMCGLTGYIGRPTRKDRRRLSMVVDDYLCGRGRVSGHYRLTGTLTSRRETTDYGIFQQKWVRLVGVSMVVEGRRSTGRLRQRSRLLGRHRVRGVVVDDADVTEPAKRHVINGRRQYDRVYLGCPAPTEIGHGWTAPSESTIV